MKKLSPTTRLTVGAMAAALGVLLMYASYILPSGKLALLFLASLVIWIPLNERGGLVFAMLCYIATALLSMLLIPNKLYALSYALFFGLYGFIKLGADSLVRERIAALVLKLLIMNALAAALLWLGGLILNQSILSLLPELPLYLLIPAAELAFIAYELLFTFSIRLYDERLRDVIAPRK